MTLKPNWSQIFRGESVTLRCDIQGTEDTDWKYEWGKPWYLGTTDQEYKIISAEKSDSADYNCIGQRGTHRSEWSSDVKLTVKGKSGTIMFILYQLIIL